MGKSKFFLIVSLSFSALILTNSCKPIQAAATNTLNPPNVYKFNYLITYNYQHYDSSNSEKRYILTNSTKPNYFILAHKLDSLQYRLVLKDHEKLISEFKLAKIDLFSNDTIDLPCNLVNKFENAYKYQVKNYVFFNLKDTLIAEKPYKYYKLVRLKKSKTVKKKIGKNHYVIEGNTQWHKPILRHSTAYEEFKLEKNIPDGIFKIHFF